MGCGNYGDDGVFETPKVATQVRWGGFCGSEPKIGNIVGYSVAIDSRLPLVHVTEEGYPGRVRVLTYTEVTPVDGVFDPSFFEAIEAYETDGDEESDYFD